MNGSAADTITARIAHHARTRPDHPALIFEGREISYAELHRESNRASHALRAAGIGRGDRVAYLGKESDLYYELVLGCVKTGAVMVPINWRLTAGEVDHVLRDSDAVLLFAEPGQRRAVERIRDQLPGLREVNWMGDYAAWKAPHPDTDVDPRTGSEDAILQMYTSGTTGMPKGVVLAHRTYFTFIANMKRAGLDWIDFLPEDRALISFPGLHSGGMAWFMHGVNVGWTSVIMRMFVPEEAVRLMKEHRVTNTFCAPAMLKMILDEPGAGKEAFASLRKVVYGGAPMPPELQRRCVEEFGCDLAQMYASAETGSVVTCLTPAEHLPGSAKSRSAGRACPGNRVRIIDAQGRPLPAGEIGQIELYSPARFIEYWKNPEATKQVQNGEWMRMPDAGYLDEDGYLYVCDRINDMIITAGQNIYPVEVENAICAAHPAVAEAAVVGVPDERWGEVAKAVVVLRPGEQVSGRELAVALQGRIAGFKIPAFFEFTDRLPRNPTGKVLRRELRDPAGHGAAR